MIRNAFRSIDIGGFSSSWDDDWRPSPPPTPEEIAAREKAARDEATRDLLKHAGHNRYANEGKVDTSVNFYLKQGADIEATAERSGQTPLGIACSYHNTVTAMTLIRAGAKIDHLDNYGHTPFTIVCQYGYLELMECLLKEGADVNQRNKDGVTPLMWAATHCRIEAAQVLLAEGAQLDAADKDGKTIFDYCRDGKDDGRVYGGTFNPQTGQRDGGKSGTLAFADLERIVLDCWRAQHVTQGCPALDAAFASKILNAGVAQRDVDIVDLALAAGANVNLPDFKGTPALVTATRNRDAVMMEKLIRLGADINAPDAAGMTPLMVSMFWYSGATVKCLMDHNAHVDLKNKHGKTALDFAWQGVMGYDQLEGRTGRDIYDELKTAVEAAAKRQSLEQYQTGLRKPMTARPALTLGKAQPKPAAHPTALRLKKPAGP